jgi:hypothetical protein
MNREHERGDSQSAPRGNARSLMPSLECIKYLWMADGQRAADGGQRAKQLTYEREAARAREGDEGLEAQPGARTPARVFHALNGGWCVSPGGRWTVAENGRNLG